MSIYDCDHLDQTLCKRVYSNASIHFVYQCCRCGHVGNAISHEEAEKVLQGKEAKPYDRDLRQRFYDELSARNQPTLSLQ